MFSIPIRSVNENMHVMTSLYITKKSILIYVILFHGRVLLLMLNTTSQLMSLMYSGKTYSKILNTVHVDKDLFLISFFFVFEYMYM